MTAPKTKEEIVRKLANGWVGGMTGGDEERIVYPAMDEYAKQQAIAFFKWNEGVLMAFYNKYILAENNDELEVSTFEKMDFDKLTTEERYEMFVNQPPMATLSVKPIR